MAVVSASPYTCRNCDLPVYLRESENRWDGDWWSHQPDSGTTRYDDPEKACRNEALRPAIPKQMCWATKGEGGYCTTKVKPENVDAGDYSCGVHMRQWLEKKEYEQWRKENNAKEQERLEIAEWEISIYQTAYDNLASKNPELFPDSRRPTLVWGRPRNTEIHLDVVELERFMRAVANVDG